MNGVRQGAISSGILFNLYLNEVISDLSKLPVEYTLIYSKVNMLGYADDLVLVVLTTQALQFFAKSTHPQALYTVTPSKCAEVMQYCL